MQKTHLIDGEDIYIVNLLREFNREAFIGYSEFIKPVNKQKSQLLLKILNSLESFELSNYPNIESLPIDWCKLIGYDLIRLIIKNNLYKESSELLKLSTPIVLINSEPCDELLIPTGQSKFGGCPDLPRDMKWPTCEKGPINFLGQINFNDIKDSITSKYYDFPDNGLLLVFAIDYCDEGLQPGVMEIMDMEGEVQLFYVKDLENLERRQTPKFLEEHYMPYKSCKPHFYDSIDIPWGRDLQHSPFIDKQNKDSIDEIRADNFMLNSQQSKIMGYPIHLRSSNGIPSDSWLNLFTFGSVKNLEWSWCDGENLDIYLPKESLSNKSFKKVFGYAS